MGSRISFTTRAFEGPLDLLLYLIQKAEVSIYDIPIAEITDQFLAMMGRMEKGEVPTLGEMSDFCRMAADLIWIKSRMLLPVEVKFDEEYEDPRQELVERLLEYQKFKKLSHLLLESKVDGGFRGIRKKSSFLLPFTDGELWAEAGLGDLLRTYLGLMENIGKVSEEVFDIYEEVTVKEKIALIAELVEARPLVHFTDIVVKLSSAEHVVCAFLAVLDCVKDEMVLVRQDAEYGDIEIRKRPENYTFDDEGAIN